MIQDRQSANPTTLDQLDLRDSIEDCGEPMKKTISVQLTEEDPTKIMQIWSLLDEEAKSRMIHFLKGNVDVFAWSASDMPGIPAEVIIHRLKAVPDYSPVR